jgi:regulator of sigma E protease
MEDILGQFHSVGAFLGLVLGFGFLIFIHELGHHLVAKWVGIRVTQFAIGFGPGIVAWRKGLGLRRSTTEPEYEKRIADGADPATMGETEYRLNWVPLGGYVKMLGQEDLNPEASASEDERSFSRKPIWARACVVSAGVVMNMIFGVIFFIIAFMAGMTFPPAEVGSVRPNSAAAVTHAMGYEGDETYRGLRPGDRVTHIDGEPITDFADLAVNTALAESGSTLKLTVQREGQPPLIFPVTPVEDPRTKLLALGVGRPISLTIQEPVKGEKLPTPLENAGVEPGMTITAVAGQAVTQYHQFEQRVSAGQGQPVTVTLTDSASNARVDVMLTAQPMLDLSDDNQPHLLGLVPAIKIPKVVERSPAAKAGMLPGDVLARIGPVAWPTWKDVTDVVKHYKTQPINIAVLRDGQTIEIEPVTPDYGGTIGIHHGLALDLPIIARTLPGSPLAGLNLNPGSRILTINGQAAGSYGDIQRLLSAAVADANTTTDSADAAVSTVLIGYQPNIAHTAPATAPVAIDGPMAQRLADAQWLEPLGPYAFKGLLITIKGDNPIAATSLGIQKAHQVMLQTYITLLRLFQGTIKPSHLQGPLGIANHGTTFAKQGWTYLMFFLGLISVNLVVVNFLPIPIVDGGLMVFLIIEKLKGSPVSVRVQNAATMVGLAMIGSVFLMTLYFNARDFLGL